MSFICITSLSKNCISASHHPDSSLPSFFFFTGPKDRSTCAKAPAAGPCHFFATCLFSRSLVIALEVTRGGAKSNFSCPKSIPLVDFSLKQPEEVPRRPNEWHEVDLNLVGSDVQEPRCFQTDPPSAPPTNNSFTEGTPPKSALPPPDPQASVYIGGLPRDLQTLHAYQLFAPFGALISIDLQPDPRADTSYAYIQYRWHSGRVGRAIFFCARNFAKSNSFESQKESVGCAYPAE